MKKYICFILFSLFSIVSFGQKGHEHRVSGMTGTSPSNQDDTSGIAIDPVMYAGGSNDQPYIITLRPMVKTDSLETLPESGQLQEIQYFNHLGLPTEKIRKGFTPALNDLITLQEYDGMNREIRQWLPFQRMAFIGNLSLHWKIVLSANIPIQVLFKVKTASYMRFILGVANGLSMRK